jgi:hypothetical protein
MFKLKVFEVYAQKAETGKELEQQFNDWVTAPKEKHIVIQKIEQSVIFHGSYSIIILSVFYSEVALPGERIQL